LRRHVLEALRPAPPLPAGEVRGGHGAAPDPVVLALVGGVPDGPPGVPLVGQDAPDARPRPGLALPRPGPALRLPALRQGAAAAALGVGLEEPAHHGHALGVAGGEAAVGADDVAVGRAGAAPLAPAGPLDGGAGDVLGEGLAVGGLAQVLAEVEQHAVQLVAE